MIDRCHRLSISRQAKLVGISRGSVYYRPKPLSTSDLALMRQTGVYPKETSVDQYFMSYQ